jgi:hypothetical protein
MVRHHSAANNLLPASLATTVRPCPAPTGAAAAMATASTLCASDWEPKSARTTAHTRKMSRPVVTARTAAAGPAHTC